MDFARFTFILSLCAHAIYGISVEILKPNTTHEADAALVIVPAAKLTMFAYKPLGKSHFVELPYTISTECSSI